MESWTDIVFIRMVKDDVIAVCKDGTLRTTISRYNGTFAAENEIQLFEDIDTLAEKIAADRAAAYSAWKQWRNAGAEEAQEEEIEAEDPYAEQREELEHQLEVIHRELEGLKGIFTMKRRRELEEKMGRILLELDELG